MTVGARSWRPCSARGLFAADADTSIYIDSLAGRVKLLDHPKARPANLTVEAWMKPVTGIVDWSGALMKTTTDARTDGYGLYYSAGTINFLVNNYSTGAGVRPDQPGHMDVRGRHLRR